MKELINQIRRQFLLLQKNNIITISLAVTVFYGLLFWVIKDLGNTDKIITFIVMNDPAVIGYFFIALSIITEKRKMILAAFSVTPMNPRYYLISKVFSLSVLGWVCALGLGFFAFGFNFDIFLFSIAVFGISAIAVLFGVVMLTFHDEFLKFALYSIPVFLLFINVPILQYFGVIDLGVFKYLFPFQSGIDLLESSYAEVRDVSVIISSILQLIFWVSAFYFAAFRLFYSKIWLNN